MFHFLSAITEICFDENDIGYDKIGVQITGYDKNKGGDIEQDISMCATGLNEGITEMLAMQVTDRETPESYVNLVYYDQILSNGQDNSLIKAYFSEGIEDFKLFLDEFNKRQSSISSKDLVKLSEYNIIDVNVLKGCIQYSISFCNNLEELENEKQRLLEILKNIKNNFRIEFPNKEFDINSFLDELISSRKKEFKVKENSFLNPDSFLAGVTQDSFGRVNEAKKEASNAKGKYDHPI